MINNYLKSPEEVFLGTASKPFRAIKNMVLGGGLPFTAANWHGLVNVPGRTFAATRNPFTAGRAFLEAFVPATSEKYLTKHGGEAVEAVRHGLSFGGEGFMRSLENPRTPTSFMGALKMLSKDPEAARFAAFEKPIFTQRLPAEKLRLWNQVWKDFAGSMPEEQAKKQAASYVNDVYGGLFNPGQSKELQNALNMAFLAPDWATTKLNLLGKGIKGIVKPDKVGRNYLATLGGMAGGVALAEGAREAITGETSPRVTQAPNIPIPGKIPGISPEEKQREFTPFASSVESTQFPLKLADAYMKGGVVGRRGVGDLIESTLRYNTNPVWSTGLNLLRNKSPFYNERLFVPDEPGISATRIGGELLNLAPLAGLGRTVSSVAKFTPLLAHPSVQSAYDVAFRRLFDPDTAKSIEEGLTQAGELPFRYYRQY